MIRALLRPLLAALLFAPPAACLALPLDRGYHQFVSDTWGLEDGLPQVTARAIAQDGDGFVWVATDGGLGRLDGLRFERFLRDRHPALGTNSTLALHHDRAGRLWIGTGRGVVYRENGAFHALLAGTTELGEVVAMVEDGLGDMYFGGQRLFRYRRGTTAPVELRDVDGRVRSLTTHDGAVWAATETGLYRIGRGPAERVPLGAADGTTINRVLGLDVERLLLATDAGLFVFRAGAVERLSIVDPRDARRDLSGTSFSDVIVDDSGAIWAGSYDALVRLAPDRRVIDVVDAAEGNSAISFFEDREHNLWIGTRAQGVSRLWAGRAQVFGTRDGLGEPLVWSMLALDDGAMLVGTYRGLYRFDGRRFELLVRPESLASGDAYSLARGPDGRVWIGGERGLTELALAPRVAARRVDALPQAKIINIDFAPDGTMWLATSQGLFAGRDDAFERVGAAAGIETAFALHRDRGGRLWVGTRTGLFEVAGTGARRHADPTLARAFVTAIGESADGELFVGTYEDGFFVVDPRDPAAPVRRHVRVDTLAITGLVSTPQQLWITTLSGIVRAATGELDTLAAHVDEKYVVSDFGDKPGSQRARCCNGLSTGHALVAYDALWVATSHGLLKIPLNPRVDSAIAPLVHVQSVRDGSRHYDVAEGTVALDGDDRDVEIAYTALSFQDPRNLRFRYRLLGLADKWVEVGERRTAYFTNLGGGTYRFQVDAVNSAGTRAERPDEIVVSVPLRWYETRWVLALLAVAGIVVLAALYWLLLRRQRQRRRALEDIVARRTAELQGANALLELGQHDLSVLGEIGREITATLDRDAVLRTLDRHVHALLDAPRFGVYLLEPDGRTLVSVLLVEGGRDQPLDRIDVDDAERACAQCLREQREILVVVDAGTRLFAPLAIGGRAFGLMTIQATRRDAYGERERMIFRTLCSYGAIALDNASAYRRLAETDATLQRTLLEQQVIFDYASGAIQFTRGRKIVRCNRGMEELLGYGPGELTGQETRIFFESDAAWEEFGNYGYPLLANGGVAQGETAFVRRDGTKSHVLYSGKAVDPTDVAQGVVWVAQDITERKHQERTLLEGKQQVEQALRRMQHSHRQVSLLGELTGFLQACPSADDAYACIRGYGPQLFPGSVGALYLFDDDAAELVEKAFWSADATHGQREQTLGATECWALRRGQPHRVDHPAGVLCCRHVAAMGGERRPYVCVPVGAQGKTFGLLFVEHRTLEAGELLDVPQGLAIAMGEQAGLSLANIRLRDALT